MFITATILLISLGIGSLCGSDNTQIVINNQLHIAPLFNRSYRQCYACPKQADYEVACNNQVTYCCAEHVASVQQSQSVTIIFDGKQWGIVKK